MQRKDVPMREVMLVVQQRQRWWESHLVEQYPYKVVLRRVEQMVDMGLLGYGSSIASPWPEEPWRDGCLPDDQGRIAYGWPH